MLQAAEEIHFILGKVCNPGHVDGYNTDGACVFSGTKVSSILFPQFTKVQAESAAHGSHIAGLHIAVDIVGEIRGSVFCGHLEKETVVFCVRPVKISGDTVSRNRVGESAAVTVTFHHNFDECFVDHGHLFFTITISEVLLFSSHNSRKILQVVRTGPVKGNVGERSLGSPSGGDIHTIDEGLHALFYIMVCQIIYFDKGSKIGVKGAESLSSCPLILKDTQEVNHLTAKGGQVFRRCGRNLSCYPAKAFPDQFFQIPACAVSGQHPKVVNMDCPALIGIYDLLIIEFTQPVSFTDTLGVIQNHSSHRIGYRCILFYMPVLLGSHS